MIIRHFNNICPIFIKKMVIRRQGTVFVKRIVVFVWRRNYDKTSIPRDAKQLSYNLNGVSHVFNNMVEDNKIKRGIFE